MNLVGIYHRYKKNYDNVILGSNFVQTGKKINSYNIKSKTQIARETVATRREIHRIESIYLPTSNNT